TRWQAARHLGCAEGTVASRLVRARALLAKRLARHGLSLTVSALALVLSQKAVSARVPPSLVASTMGAASLFKGGTVAAGLLSAKVAALTEGVLKAMFMSNLKSVTAVLLAATLAGAGSGGLLYRTQAAEPANRPQAAWAENGPADPG